MFASMKMGEKSLTYRMATALNTTGNPQSIARKYRRFYRANKKMVDDFVFGNRNSATHGGSNPASEPQDNCPVDQGKAIKLSCRSAIYTDR